MRASLVITAVFLSLAGLRGQMSGEAQSGAAILHQLQKMQNTSRVLYLAAHPDDENTRLISWLENDRKIRTAYLSLTRGDGGQNLIGPELGAKLGVLRTQELMQARQIDGGEQFFSRAVDFGYSKTAEETLEFWDREKTLADVVRVIRDFRPDVIITRFPADSRGGHGHHTASAILALEAFDRAGDAEAFPKQLQNMEPWSPKRIYWNHSTWWGQNLDSIAKVEPGYLKYDVGTYLPLLGLSCNEMASHSRTQHKSQGFGVSVSRGSQHEYLKLLKGPEAPEDFMQGVPTAWDRYDLPQAQDIIDELIENYDPREPQKSVPKLLAFRKELLAKEFPERAYFLKQVNRLIKASLGIHLELLAGREYLVPGDSLDVKLRALQRSGSPWQAERLSIGEEQWALSGALTVNEYREWPFSTQPKPGDSQPYWLRQDYQNVFTVADARLIGKPENAPVLTGRVSLRDLATGDTLSLVVPVEYKTTDRVEGELRHRLATAPPFTLSAGVDNLIFVGDSAQKLNVELRAFAAGTASFTVSAPGWEVTPKSQKITFEEAGQRKTIQLWVKPQAGAEGTTSLQFSESGKPLQSIHEIDYPHIDKRVVYEKAEVKLVRISLAKRGQRVAYIPGAGDEVVEAIEQMGYAVDVLDEQGLKSADLDAYQAVVAGIRAYNTQPWLFDMREKLLDYVAQGGNYIVQYNTRSSDFQGDDIGPLPFTISHERVTEEDAPVTRLLPKSAVFWEPNRLSEADFQGWVQERGLYFASEWDQGYQAPIGWHDKDEPQRKGGLLLAEHGKGTFIYTGISFFRELPAGVPGAYRLLANLISYQKQADE